MPDDFGGPLNNLQNSFVNNTTESDKKYFNMDMS